MVFQTRIVPSILKYCVPPVSADDASLSICASLIGARLVHHPGFRYDPRRSGPDWVTVHHVRPDKVAYYYGEGPAVKAAVVASATGAAGEGKGQRAAASGVPVGAAGSEVSDGESRGGLSTPPPPRNGVLLHRHALPPAAFVAVQQVMSGVGEQKNGDDGGAATASPKTK